MKACLLLSSLLCSAAMLHAESFTFDNVRLLARERAKQPYVEPENKLAEFWKNLTYDEHRDIRFKMDQGLWAKEKLPFSIDFFHPGWTAKKTVTVEEIVDGVVKPVTFDQAMFNYGKTKVPAGTPPPPGYAGWRATNSIHQTTWMNSWCSLARVISDPSPRMLRMVYPRVDCL
jgi:periplasmic glucans biosynthesis protein